MAFWVSTLVKTLFMKRFLLSITLILITSWVIAQDVIVKKDGSTILSKVEKVGITEIEFKKWSNQDGPIYTINRSEVLSINYQNGDIDSFCDNNSSSQGNMASASDLPVYVKGQLKHVRRNTLSLDDKILSDNEAKKLLGTEAYENFLKGVRLKKVGDRIMLPGILSVIVGSCMIIVGIQENQDYGFLVVGVPLIGLGLPCSIAGTIVSNSGTHMIKNVVTEYNMNNDKVVSFNFSPTIMRSLSQSNLGLGVTFNMNF